MKKIIFVLFIVLISGCTNKKCIKSHEEKDSCVVYSYIEINNTFVMIPHYYDCTRTVCDEYEEVSE